MQFMPTENAGTLRAERAVLRRRLQHLPKCSSHRPRLEQQLAEVEAQLPPETPPRASAANAAGRGFVLMSDARSEIHVSPEVVADGKAPRKRAPRPTSARQAYAEPQAYFERSSQAQARPKPPVANSPGAGGQEYAEPVPYFDGP
jgi:hypothetical protein